MNGNQALALEQQRHLAEKRTNGRAQELSAIQLQPSPVSMVNL